MEFDDMKKIWDAQNNEALYLINEKALYKRIQAKKKQGQHITNISELLWIIGNISIGCLILVTNLFKQSTGIFIYCLSAWMIASALYILVRRIRRIKENNRFDRSLRGDLDHAISMATYQVHLSQLGRCNLLLIVMLFILGVWESGKSLWWMVGLLIFFVLINHAAGWEYRIYKARKRELDGLQNKLENEALSDTQTIV